MAKFESKTIQVHPQNEQATVARMERFGWELKSVQDVVTKDSHEELHGDTVYSVTETERYIKLMFQRDTQGEHYAIYKRGEDLYDEIQHLEKKSNHGKFSFSFWPHMPKWLYIVIVVACFIAGSGIGSSVTSEPTGMVYGWIGSIAAVAAVIIVCRIVFIRPKALERHKQMGVEAEQAKVLLAQKRAEFNELGL